MIFDYLTKKQIYLTIKEWEEEFFKGILVIVQNGIKLRIKKNNNHYILKIYKEKTDCFLGVMKLNTHQELIKTIKHKGQKDNFKKRTMFIVKNRE